MRRLLLRIWPTLQLTRVSTAFAAVSNVWFVILWSAACPDEPRTRAFTEFPLWALLTGAAFNALGLFAFATTLNDVLDFRRDLALHPNRPIPSGRVSLSWAITLAVCTLGVAVLGATVLGMTAVVLTLLVAGAALFYNAVGRFIPALGLVALGLIYAGQMVVPNLNLRFVFPVWLVMTHSLLVAAAVHILGRKTPGISARAAVVAVGGWIFWSSVMFGVAWWRNRDSGGVWPNWLEPRLWLWPLLLSLLFLILVWRRLSVLGRGPRVAEKIARYGSLWLSLYATAWLLGQGYTPGGTLLGLLTVAGVVGMTVMRELFALLDQPIGYRR